MTTEPIVRQPDTPLVDLTPGTYIHWRDERGIQPIQVARLLHVERYQGARPMVAALVELPGGPELLRRNADHLVVVATPEDIAAAGEGERRAALVAALHELADDIEDKQLPVPTYRAEFVVVARDRSVVERWAEYLGAAVTVDEGIPAVYGGQRRVLEVRVQSAPEPDAHIAARAVVDVKAGE